MVETLWVEMRGALTLALVAGLAVDAPKLGMRELEPAGDRLLLAVMVPDVRLVIEKS